MHGLEIPHTRVAIGAIVMQPDVIGRVGLDEAHKLLEPPLPVGIIGDGRADQLLIPVLAQGHHVGVPGVGGALGRDGVLVGFVEEVDEGLVRGLDVVPVRAGELGFEVDHGAEGAAGVELGRGPGVPVAERGEGRGGVEVGLVEGPGDAGVVGAGAVGPVPEEAALFDDHGWTFGCIYIYVCEIGNCSRAKLYTLKRKFKQVQTQSMRKNSRIPFHQKDEERYEKKI